MSPAKRIILNAFASYGRTLFNMALGLFSARWVLNGLGKEDYGLFGVVGGVIVFVSILNGILSSSISRYYAYAIGEAKSQDEKTARENLMRWFNSALSIHWVLPIILVAIGYPLGVYAFRHWLLISESRLPACIWVFRLSMLTAFMNMVSVPYIAMYQAKQLIAELSIWGIATTAANFLIAYYMLFCPYDRFIVYAYLSAIVPSLILGIQIFRARKHFGVCHIHLPYLFEWKRLKQVFSFAFWDFFGWFGGTVRDQGAVFVINRNFGAGMNASYRIAQSVIGYTSSLSMAISGALQPAITTSVGQGDLLNANKLAFRTSKFSTLMVLLFAVPVMVEIDEVLCLWLIDPPECTASFCRSILVATVILKLAWGHHIAVCARGKIALFQSVLGGTACLSLGMLAFLIAVGIGPLSVGYMFVIAFFVMMVERIIFARLLIGMSILHWLYRIFLPLLAVACLSGGVSYAFSRLFEPSFLRVCGTSIVSVLILMSTSWVGVLDREEREFIVLKFRERILR